MGRKKGSRNYPQEFKRRVVGQALSAPSIAAVARRHGLNANMVHLWCKDKRFRPAAGPAVLLPVEVVDVQRDDAPRPASVASRIEILTRNGHRLVVTDAEDPTSIANLVRALEAV